MFKKDKIDLLDLIEKQSRKNNAMLLALISELAVQGLVDSEGIKKKIDDIYQNLNVREN
ncbi:hypothetical protein ACFC0X_24980 [Paenibacillus chitinolyticus]|uniref:hypothetical protein n=1 Tax=Paenibacillus chitinolyticus TaxID=79263 RepID=UPI0035DB70BD